MARPRKEWLTPPPFPSAGDRPRGYVYELAGKFRAQLAAGERDAFGHVVDAYGTAWQAIDAEVRGHTSKLEAAYEAAGLGHGTVTADPRPLELMAQAGQLGEGPVARKLTDAARRLNASSSSPWTEGELRHAQAFGLDPRHYNGDPLVRAILEPRSAPTLPAGAGKRTVTTRAGQGPDGRPFYEVAARHEDGTEYVSGRFAHRDDADRLAGAMRGTTSPDELLLERRRRQYLTDLVPNSAAPSSPWPRHGSWAYESDRLAATREAVSSELSDAAGKASLTVQTASSDAIEAAGKHAEHLTLAAIGDTAPGFAASFTQPDLDAVRSMIGTGHQLDSPLRALLFDSTDDPERIIDNLVNGMVLGLNPRQVADAVKGVAGMGTVRALRVTRTEMLRAYREATLAGYQDNADVVRGWIWKADLGGRTCASCAAMDGTEHSLDEQLIDHPQGRCAMVPKTKTWDELGITAPEGTPPLEETSYSPELGVDRIKAMTPAQRRQLMGPRKAELYDKGLIDGQDLSALRPSRTRDELVTAAGDKRLSEQARARAATELDKLDKWGPHRTVATEREALESAAKRGNTRARAELRDRGPSKLELEQQRAKRTRLAERPKPWLEYGYSEDEWKAARVELRDLRSMARTDAKRALEHADSEVQGLGKLNPPPPLRTFTDPTTGRKTQRRLRSTDSSGATPARGEWDWWDQLSSDEQRRLRQYHLAPQARRGYRPEGIEPDQLHHALASRQASGLAGTIQGREFGTDDAAAWWVDATARQDAARAVAAGRLPSYGLDPNLATPTLERLGYDAAKVLKGPLTDPEAIEHVAAVTRDRARAEALEILPVRITHGPPPWKMSTSSFEAEVSELEYDLFERRLDSATLWARYDELVPRYLDDPDHPLPLDKLHELIVHTAKVAGL